MKLALFATLVALPVAAAQASSFAQFPSLNTPSVPGGVAGDSYANSHPEDTPTMKRQRVERLLALKAEAFKLQAEDGGMLTDANKRYLQRKANRIMR